MAKGVAAANAPAKDNLKSVPQSGMGVDCNRKFADLAPKDAVAWHHPPVETATLRRWYGCPHGPKR